MISPAGFVAAPLIIIAAAGGGAWALDLCKAGPDRGLAHTAIASAIGLVLLGWTGFWLLLAGLTGFAALSAPVAAGLICAFLYREDLFAGLKPENRAGWLVLAIALCLFGIDLAASTMPVIDADTNAYHFTLPLQFLTRGELFLVPRAVDGVTPLLFQTVYSFALKLGGETGIQLIAKLIGWLAILLVYGLLRPLTGTMLAAIGAGLLFTMPAFVYSQGTGQVEARIALLVLAGTAMLLATWKQPNTGNAIIAGLLFGGVAAAKFTGLLFAPAAFAVLLLASRDIRLLAAFALAGLIAGGQWYGWIWIETGSPVFPMFAGAPYWNSDSATAFANRILTSERPIPADLSGLLTYPFQAFWALHTGFESGRTGTGPGLFMLALPALAGLFRLFSGKRDSSQPDLLRFLGASALLAALFYLLWWYLGASQRIRHLLPLMPLLITAFMIAAHVACRTMLQRRLLVTVLLAALAVQAGGWGFYHRATLGYAAGGFDHERALRDNLLDYDAIRWMQGNLPADSLLVLLERRNNFYLDMPFYRLSSDLETIIGAGEPHRDPARFYREVRDVGGTHVLFHLFDNPAFTLRETGNGPVLDIHVDIATLHQEGNGIGRFHQLVLRLLKDRCGKIVNVSRTRRTLSRTLGQQDEDTEMVLVVELLKEGCAYGDSYDREPVNRIHTDWTGGPRPVIPGR
jgi:4-amino-4-deoxy-L-arabinose transferase-like glycosyltransferase